jgi:hypothetical protein
MCGVGMSVTVLIEKLGSEKSRWKGVRRLPLVYACEILTELRR